VKKKSIILLLFFPIYLAAVLPGFGTVEWDVESALKLETTPLDVAVSATGSWIFVLTGEGSILIYTFDGVFKDRIVVGNQVDGIDTGPQEDSLVLINKKEKTVQTVRLDFIVDINTTGSPFKGPGNAPITICVFSDFQCPYCAKLLPLLEEVLARNPKMVKLVFKNFPLPNHKFARQAAAAALAADGVGKFWEFHDKLFEYSSQLSEQKIREMAGEIGGDEKKIATEMNSQKIQLKISQDIKDAQQAGVKGTPTLFVNGRLLRNRSVEGVQHLIDAELKKGTVGKGKN
jgi:protein-disulfide isomerase